ncbi:hypothetical protein C9439_02275 [archaeon SCG-AAA382B04]|nr:hypothetical protein C9439_02275 [archaeon SCG-AAA382B04]
MTNGCEAALITCEDYRLHQRADGRNYIGEFIEDLGKDCDLITRGGGIQDIVRPENHGYSDSLMRDIEVSVELHEADTLYLVNHEDCGAYRDMDFSSRKEEIDRHYEDLKKAREIISERFQDVEIKLYFGELIPGSSDKYEIKPVQSSP